MPEICNTIRTSTNCSKCPGRHQLHLHRTPKTVGNGSKISATYTIGKFGELIKRTDLVPSPSFGGLFSVQPQSNTHIYKPLLPICSAKEQLSLEICCKAFGSVGCVNRCAKGGQISSEGDLPLFRTSKQVEFYLIFFQRAFWRWLTTLRI